MRLTLPGIALGCTLFASLAAVAQKPANATGQCKDGSYWTGSTKSGACRGHKGVQTWYADASATTAAPVKPSPAASTAPAAPPAKAAPAPAPAAPPAAAAKPTRTPPHPQANAAPGGGPGLVWVNSETKVYHCYGDRYYGKTKNGKYMTEADAKAMGAKGARGQVCSK